MRNVVYLDVLIFLNAFVSAALLLASAAMLKIDLRRRRLLIGTALGGAFSLVIFLPPLPLIINVLIKAAGCAVLSYATFGFRSWRIYLRAAATFMLANFIFAGIMLGLWSFSAPNGLIFNNGTAYWDISVLLLCVSTIFCYVVVRLIGFLTRRNAPDNHFFDLTIYSKAKTVDCKALFDSGNALRESFSGMPVIVAQKDAVNSIIPDCVDNYLLKELAATSSISPVKDFRLIPYNSVGGKGALPAFKVERVILRQGNKQWSCNEAYIAVSEKTLARGEYTALVGSVFFEHSTTQRVQVKP